MDQRILLLLACSIIAAADPIKRDGSYEKKDGWMLPLLAPIVTGLVDSLVASRPVYDSDNRPQHRNPSYYPQETQPSYDDDVDETYTNRNEDYSDDYLQPDPTPYHNNPRRMKREGTSIVTEETEEEEVDSADQVDQDDEEQEREVDDTTTPTDVDRKDGIRPRGRGRKCPKPKCRKCRKCPPPPPCSSQTDEPDEDDHIEDMDLIFRKRRETHQMDTSDTDRLDGFRRAVNRNRKRTCRKVKCPVCPRCTLTRHCPVGEADQEDEDY